MSAAKQAPGVTVNWDTLVVASNCTRQGEGGSSPYGVTIAPSPGGYGTIDAAPHLRLNVAIALLDTEW